MNQSLEAHNDALDKIRQFNERWNDRLTSENLRLSERYVEGEIYALVCFKVPFYPVEQCALFHREQGLRSGKIDGLLRDGSGWQLEQALERGLNNAAVYLESHFGDSHSCGDEQTMLVNNVKLVEFPQHVVPSTVRLESVYSIFKGLGNSFCFSDRLGYVLLQTLADREVSMLQDVPSRIRDEAVSKVVQSGTEIMGSVTSQQRDTHGNRLELIQKISRGSIFDVKLGRDLIWVERKELSDLSVQITDVLFGPFNFLLMRRIGLA